MRPYQEEYIANLEEIAALTAGRKPEDGSLEAYRARLDREERRQLELVDRSMELLRGELFPLLDHLPDAGRRPWRSWASSPPGCWGAWISPSSASSIRRC